jgi:hypothetical protein
LGHCPALIPNIFSSQVENQIEILKLLFDGNAPIRIPTDLSPSGRERSSYQANNFMPLPSETKDEGRANETRGSAD